MGDSLMQCHQNGTQLKLKLRTNLIAAFYLILSQYFMLLLLLCFAFCINFNLWIFLVAFTTNIQIGVQLFYASVCSKCIFIRPFVYLLDYIILLTFDLSIVTSSLLKCKARATRVAVYSLADCHLDRSERGRMHVVFLYVNCVRKNMSCKSISLHDDSYILVPVKMIMGTKTCQTIAANKQYTKRFIFNNYPLLPYAERYDHGIE